MVMRRTLGTIALLLALAGCGASEPDPDARDPDPSDVTQVALLSATSAGGEVTSVPTVLADAAAVREYAAQFRGEELEREIIDTASETDVPEGQQLAAAVVAVGCEVPTEVTGTSGDLHAVLPSSTKECFAPVTTVALVLVPG